MVIGEEILHTTFPTLDNLYSLYIKPIIHIRGYIAYIYYNYIVILFIAY